MPFSLSCTVSIKVRALAVEVGFLVLKNYFCILPIGNKFQLGKN